MKPKNLPCADLEAMLEECDRLAGHETSLDYNATDKIWRAGVYERTKGFKNGWGKTRREAVENLLAKLRSVKK